MKKFLLFFITSSFLSAGLWAQEIDSTEIIQLDSVVIKAFEQNKRLNDVPAAVGLINKTGLERFGSSSIVSAVNTLSGVRMEERSPGSYRFNIRGSSLRSLFGVRNVKVYYNDLPFTDPGGNTYLNSLGYYNFQTIEIIKGPASSLYGAGTGGALLISSLTNQTENSVNGAYTFGSFRSQNIYASIITGNETSKSKIGFQHQQSNGYRNQSALNRNIFSWDGNYKVFAKGILKSTFLYSDLFYETPGALTLTEYNTNPKTSRPAAGSFPSAEDAKAAIDQKTILAGLSLTQLITENLTNKTVAYGAYNRLQNPAIRNYGKNDEPHFGGRTVFTFNKKIHAANYVINAGAEWQKGFATYSVFKNNRGNADSLQTQDDVDNKQAILFIQTEVSIKNYSLTAGASLNFLNLKFQRFYPSGLGLQNRNFNNGIAPRIALLRKLNNINIYTSFSKGFSPPTTSELLPTGSAINLDLAAEGGINYDLGAKGTIFKTLSFDVNAFIFHLINTIVQRRDAGGGDFYANSGKTKQYGIESSFTYKLFKNPFKPQSILWLSHTYHQFTYKEFKQQTTDFSGNYIPGVAKNTIAAGADLKLNKAFTSFINYYYSDPIPLNDLNNAYAKPYHLLGVKVGYVKGFSKCFTTNLMLGVDNLFDQQYSLGNDINAFGGRYYNAAAGRNYFATISFNWKKPKA